MALCPSQPGRLGRKVSPSLCKDLPAGGVLGVRGLRPWALGSPGLVCLLSWASSQHPLCSSWLTSCTMVAEGGGLSGSQLGMEPCKEPGGGRPHSALTPHVYVQAPQTPSPGLQFSPGPVNFGAKSTALSSPEGVIKETWRKSSFLFPPICSGHSGSSPPTPSCLPCLHLLAWVTHLITNTVRETFKARCTFFALHEQREH